MKRPEIELFQAFTSQDKSVVQKLFEKWIKKGQVTVIFVRDKYMQSFRSFIHEGKYPVWVRTVVAGLVVKVTKLDQAIAATDDPVKQNVLISQQNKLLSYMNGLSIGEGSTDQVLLKKMRGIGKRR